MTVPALSPGEHRARPERRVQTTLRSARSEDRVQMTLPHRLEAPLLARAAVEELASESPPGLRCDTQVVVTELVTNALRHGRGDILLRLCVGHGRLSGEVIDGGEGFEVPSEPAAGMAPRGWGLAIVNDLAERWGLAEGSTHVWFEMPIEPSNA